MSFKHSPQGSGRGGVARIYRTATAKRRRSDSGEGLRRETWSSCGGRARRSFTANTARGAFCKRALLAV